MGAASHAYEGEGLRAARDLPLRGIRNPLKVPSYSFTWRLGYEMAKPVLLPKGTRLDTTTHYDNSANNPYNPNPKIDVAFGPQSTDEMAVSFLGFVLDIGADPTTLLRRQRRGPAAPPVE